MRREYRLADFPVPESRDELEQMDATLNEFGGLGWEAVSALMERDQAVLCYSSGQGSAVHALFCQSFAKVSSLDR